MINKKYIESVLARFEGKAIARGYIPCYQGTYYGGDSPDKGAPLGASGVTIATGVDLGQQTMKGLAVMGISASTLAILAPYIGLQKQEALKKLQSDPFTITAEQVEEIDTAVHNRYIEQAATIFGRELFENAPKEAQAVAVSLHYQFGTPKRPDSPGLANAWANMQQGAYKEAAECLRNPSNWSASHQIYMPRRKAEAAILDEVQ